MTNNNNTQRSRNRDDDDNTKNGGNYAILEAVAPKTAKTLISEIDKKFARK